MTKSKHIKRLRKLRDDRGELLQSALAEGIRKEIREEVEAIDAALESIEDLRSRDTEIQDLNRKCVHGEAVAKSLEDEVNSLRHKLCTANAELEKAKKPKRCYEVLFSDGSSVCVENAVSWSMGDSLTRLRDIGGRTVATIKTDDLRGLIDRGERENDED